MGERNIPATHDDLNEGIAALHSAVWAKAKTAFERALRREETPEAHDGLGIALWWLNEIEASHHYRALAYKGFKAKGDIGRAAIIACWLGREQVFLRSNYPAMEGWFERAKQLIRQEGPGLEQAWVAIMQATMTASPADMVTLAAQTIAAARQFKDSDLEAFALALYGQALVGLGNVGGGMSRLDEAMTMATGGEVTSFNVISEIFCFMLSTCDLAGDLVRSDLWCRTAMEFSQHYGCPFLSAYCRTIYGGLMAALGRWREAEVALTEAIRAFEQGHKGLKFHAVIKLADLRVCQGKIEEAEILLEGMEDQTAATLPLARLWLYKGELALARATVEQALPDSATYTLHSFPLLLLLLEIFLTANDNAGIQRVLTHLLDMSAHAQSRLLTAQFEFIRGRVSFHLGDFAAAKASFNATLAHLHTYEQSWLAGQARLRIAQVMQQSDPAGAIAWARAAMATFDRIGAQHDTAVTANLLRNLGVPRATLPKPQQDLTQREGEIVSLLALGLTNRDIANRLVISTKTVEHHVSRVLSKLGLRSRTEVAAFVASGKLSMLAEENKDGGYR